MLKPVRERPAFVESIASGDNRRSPFAGKHKEVTCFGNRARHVPLPLLLHHTPRLCCFLFAEMWDRTPVGTCGSGWTADVHGGAEGRSDATGHLRLAEHQLHASGEGESSSVARMVPSILTLHDSSDTSAGYRDLSKHTTLTNTRKLVAK